MSQPTRPQLHYTTRSTWLNDPNGLIHYNGEWHLFYQTNPHGNLWGSMSWGHAVSADLITWTELDVALLATDEIEYFSGSCVHDVNNTSGLGRDGKPPLVAIFTENYTKESPRFGTQAQGLAYSLDNGRTFTPYGANPVLTRTSSDFRDPKVSWLTEHGFWLMTAVEAIDNIITFYRSDNLIDWTLLSEFGPANALSPTWECPDLFPLVVEGTTITKWVLIVSLNPAGLYGGSGVQYFVGDFDGETFRAETIDSTDLRDFNWLDFGADFYAPITFNDVPDGRRITMGWMSNWTYARQTPTAPWRGAMSLPRELSLTQCDGRYLVRQRTTREFATTNLQETLPQGTVLTGELILLPELITGAIELRLRPTSGQVTLTIGDVCIDYVDGRLELNRGECPGAPIHPDFALTQWMQTPLDDGLLELLIVVDIGSIEVFAQGGLYVLTSLTYGQQNREVKIATAGDMTLDEAKAVRW
ncbi:MAG TPA: glycoside hydrolase family 32 protein [Propionibacteriaceae bacterium]|nr:glycoside hydrolase family 32 protein [Propionibacteriaceae bacterium]